MPALAPQVLPQVLEVVRRAGRRISENAGKAKTVEMKGRIDLVTDTDKAVEEELLERLADVLPGSHFLAEESTEELSEAELQDNTWVIDPLDGTTNFAHDLPICAVSVGLWHEGNVELGVVHLPILNETFHAVRGGGAFLNGVPIRCTGVDDLEKTLVATGFPYSIQDDLDVIMAKLGKVLYACQGLRRMGAAAVDLAYVAAGRLDAFYEMSLKPWDVAAGKLLVEEAGGVVTEWSPETPHGLFSPTILAAGPGVHGKMGELLS
jgi:myo-inositol-1(or 4)-monophosphatase